jgi:hypothetical protein
MSDEPTKNVDPPAMPPTQPTLETILERINALGERMDAKLTEVRDGQEKIKNELWALRTVFSRSYGDLMIGQEMHERRISDLEKKVS